MSNESIEVCSKCNTEYSDLYENDVIVARTSCKCTPKAVKIDFNKLELELIKLGVIKNEKSVSTNK